MSREVRKVAADWQHPKKDGRFVPMFDSEYEQDAREFLQMANEKGLQCAVDLFGKAPDKNEYMPSWPDGERTHFMMYETTSEGTPISPAFETPQELARWLTDTGASAFGSRTATYEQWLRVCDGGFAPSCVIHNGDLKSGVEGLTE